MTYIISTKVRVDIRSNGADLSGEYGPDSKDIPTAVGDHLVALGLAEVSKSSAVKKAVAKDNDTITEETE
jgi:hypothetical protein